MYSALIPIVRLGCILSTIFMCCACGSEGGDGDKTGAYQAALTFPENIPRTGPEVDARIDCAAAGIAYIRLTLFNEDNLVVKGERFACVTGHAVMSGIPAGSNLSIVATAEDKDQWILLQGVGRHVEIRKGQDTSGDEIVMKYVTDDGGTDTGSETSTTTPTETATETQTDTETTTETVTETQTDTNTATETTTETATETQTDTGADDDTNPQPASTIIFTLLNADSDRDLFEMEDNATISLGVTGPALNVRADFLTETPIAMVRFHLSGSQISDLYRNEYLLPYALAGDDTPGDYNVWNPTPSDYTLRVTAYADIEAASIIQQGSIRFQVVP